MGNGPVEALGAGEARRWALAAQGLGGPRPARPGLAHVRAVAQRLGALQIDAVNVLVRAHFLPAFSRLGPYPVDALERLVNVRHELVELPGHQASYVPVELEPLLRWRRQLHAERWYGGWRARVDPAYVDAVEAEVVARGPLAVADLEDARRRPRRPPAELTIRRKDGQPYAESSLLWGRSSHGKTVLDGLLHEGRLALAGRRKGGADRLYDVAERVLPAAVREAPTPALPDARRELVRRSAAALGVTTVTDLAGYFELKVADTKIAVQELVEEGALVEVAVEGWKGPAYVPVPSPPRVRGGVEGPALLGPFDSLTWSRERTRRIFGFDHSFEIYVPEAKRRYGYYVLPFLLGSKLVARVDLKADRAAGVLRVPGAFAEEGVDVGTVAAALRGELERTASWLGLDSVEVGERGDLVGALTR
jgi:uncharacterized protein